MIRTFIQERTDWDELMQIDTESGKVKIYAVDKELGFPFSEYYTTLSDMGYNSITNFIKRMRKIKDAEIDTDQQTEKEIQGLINLAKHRAEHGGNVFMKLKDGMLYNDIAERLRNYGLSESEAMQKLENIQIVKNI